MYSNLIDLNFAQRLKDAYSAFRSSPELPFTKEDGIFIPINQGSRTFDDLQLLKDYTEIPEVSAIVSMKSKAFSKMIVRQVSKDTGQDMKNQQNLIKVLRNPNWFQSWKEFVMQTKAFREIWGNEYLFLNYPFGLPSRRAKAMYTLPPYLVTTKTPQDMPFFMYIDPDIEYFFKWGNKEYEIEKENICHLNDNRVTMDKDNWVDGQSWLAFQRAPVNNIRAAYKARGFFLDNVGVQGILTNAGQDTAGTQIMDKNEKEDLQKRLNAMGKRKGYFPALITSLALDWKKIGLENPQNLGLFQEVQEDFYKLCDAAGTPSILFSSANGVTFENQKWAERRLYENTIIPEAEEWIGALNAQFETEKESWEIVGSYTHLNVFQENMKERGQSLQMLTGAMTNALQAGAIGVTEYQEELRRFGIVIGNKP